MLNLSDVAGVIRGRAMCGAVIAVVCQLSVSPFALAQGEAVGAKTSKRSDWPHFLGPHRSGVSDETGLLDEWPADGPKEVWRAPGGVGMSGLAISRGRLVTMWQDQASQFVVALDARSGKSLWRIRVSKAYDNSMGDGPRATPAIAGDRVFAFSGDGVLSAHRFDNGAVVWRHDTLVELGGKPADYGMACSPLIAGDLVIVTVGANGAAVVAYQRETGKLAWKTGNDRAGYSSPALLRAGGREQIVAFTGQSAIGLMPATGKPLWRYPFKTNFDCNIATPLAHNGRVFLSAGENHGCVLLALEKAGDGYEAKEVWQSYGLASVMRNGWQTSILHEGHLYGLDNVGAASSLTHLNCVNIETGERVWQRKRFGNGNLIAADGKLILTTMKGELVFVKMTTDGYQEIGRKKVLGKIRQSAALAGGHLYLRDDREIVCIDVRKAH